MYHCFTIRRFRCFEELTLGDLARVNLIAGKNNVGKTALLEAIFLHCGGQNSELAIRVNTFRGMENVSVAQFPWGEPPWVSLFYRFDTLRDIEIEGQDHLGKARTLRIRSEPEPVVVMAPELKAPKSFYEATSAHRSILFESQQDGEKTTQRMSIDLTGVRIEGFSTPPFPAFFYGARTRLPCREQADLFSALEVQKKEQFVVRALQILEPRLERLSVASSGGQVMLHADVGTDKLVPLPLMGEGMVRIADFAVCLGNASDGVVLIDEFENGIHHSVLKKVWSAVAQAAREFNTQVFATTHSWECIVAAHEAFCESDEYDFRLHRLERSDGRICVITYDQKTLQAAIETGLEVR
jgi:hypothetical protein